MTDSRTDTDALIDELNRRDYVQLVPTAVGGVHVVLSSEGAEVLDYSRLIEGSQKNPSRLKGHIKVHDIESMDQLIKQFCSTDDGAVVIYADADSCTFTAVLNDHDSATPGWRDHRIIYQLQNSPAMNAWLEFNGKLVSQTAFAEHIEARLKDIIDPSNGEMLEIAQTFSATTSTDFRSSHRLQSGVIRFQYLQEQEAKAGTARELDIPNEFRIYLSPFIGSDETGIKARFRYRLTAGELSLGYILEDVEEMRRREFSDIVEDLQTRSDYLVVRGNPA